MLQISCSGNRQVVQVLWYQRSTKETGARVCVWKDAFLKERKNRRIFDSLGRRAITRSLNSCDCQRACFVIDNARCVSLLLLSSNLLNSA